MVLIFACDLKSTDSTLYGETEGQDFLINFEWLCSLRQKGL